MKFEFVSKRDFNIIGELAKQMGCEHENDILKFPINIGKGYIKMLDLETGLKLVIQRHKLKRELVFKRNASADKNNLVTITFNSADRPIVFLQDTANEAGINLSSIYVTSTDIGLETCFPANKNIHSTIIIIHTGLLKKFLETHTENKLIQSITSGTQSFWYNAIMTPDMQHVLTQMDDANGSKHFSHLFYTIKIQQLIYHLFVELLEKENRPHHSLQPSDIEKMYLIRETILSSLNTPPLLYNLARTVGISETKMKQFFRQIFGNSIYNFYQGARMEAAAKLLKHFSVSETGFKLGFTNMSYFARLFKKHHNETPKKFKSALQL